MSVSVEKRSMARPTGSPGPFRSVLVPVDLTSISDRVLARVARLPLAADARLTLLHVVPDGLAARARDHAVRDARRALADETGDLARILPEGLAINAQVEVGSAAREIAACASASRAELVVMGRGGGRALREVFLGSTAERVIRRGQIPVLVVRLPARADYERRALAVDVDQAAHDVITTMLRVIPCPRPRVAVIHAFDVPYRGLIYPSLIGQFADQQRHAFEDGASAQVAKLLDSSLVRARIRPADAPRWRTQVRLGSPRQVIVKAVQKAHTDLLVLGTHGRTGVAHVFLGTVAGDVLRDVACDVLVVPPLARNRAAR
jgi:nucleotide-binding universal stress UspA family protein